MDRLLLLETSGQFKEKGFLDQTYGMMRSQSYRFRAPEALFQPVMLGLEAVGIHESA